MKKAIAALLASVIMLVFLCPCVNAENISKEQKSAEALNYIGMFLGTDVGYELDRLINREEAVTMIVRLVGGVQEALDRNYAHPFKDVPDWADPYIGYAYKYGIVLGISDTKFGAGLDIKYCEYMTMLLRTLNYKDEGYNGSDFVWDKPYDLARRVGLVQSGYEANLTAASRIKRGEIANLSFTVLGCSYKGVSLKVSAKLIAGRVFTDINYSKAIEIAKVGKSAYEASIAVKDTSGTLVSYTVAFLDYNGALLKRQTVIAGDNATAPASPVREGYTFTGWSESFENIKAPLTVTALYTPKTYTVTFLDRNGVLLGTQTVSYGTKATAPTIPEVEGCDFAGWSEPITCITEAITVRATYKLKADGEWTNNY